MITVELLRLRTVSERQSLHALAADHERSRLSPTAGQPSETCAS